MELQQIEHREAYVRGRSAAGSRSRRWRVSNKIHIRPVDEGFTYDGILKLRTHFIDPEWPPRFTTLVHFQVMR